MGTYSNIELKLHDGSTKMYSLKGCMPAAALNIVSAPFWKKNSLGIVEAPDERKVFEYLEEELTAHESEYESSCSYDFHLDLSNYAKSTFGPTHHEGEKKEEYPLLASCAFDGFSINRDILSMVSDIVDRLNRQTQQEKNADTVRQEINSHTDEIKNSNPFPSDRENGYSTNVKWAVRYFEIAELVSTWSKDPSTKVGAIIVGDKGQIIAQGYNGFPRGVEDRMERYNHRETKYKFVVHAEMNAILNALYNGSSVAGASIYIHNLPVCQECAKAIIQSGIAKVFIDTEIEGKWLDAWQISKVMFKEAGVKVYLLSEDKTKLIQIE